MKPLLPDLPICPEDDADPVEQAARALLAAIEAEPVPPHLAALARSLQAALDDRPDDPSQA